MASSGSRVEVSVTFSNRVHRHSFSPWAPRAGEHRTIRERSRATLVRIFPSSLDLGLVGHRKRGPIKCVPAILPFAAVEVWDVLLVTGEQLHAQVFPGVSQLP